MCDHDESKQSVYLEIFGPVGEVYMCECGVLVDIQAEKNHDNPVHPMTSEELTHAVWLLLDMAMEDAGYEIHRLRHKYEQRKRLVKCPSQLEE